MSNEQQAHDLTMLYLKSKYTDSAPSPEVLSKEYLEIFSQIIEKLR